MSTVDSSWNRLPQHRAEVNGIRLYYSMAGSGDPLVLLHGFPETSYAWRKVVPALTEHFTVITPDLRGCGSSDRPSGGYDKTTIATDVHELVSSLGLGPVTLVGHDVAMMVAYAYAADFADDVTRLVLMDAALPGLGLEDLFDAQVNPRMWHLPLFEAPDGLAEALITGREAMFVDQFMLSQTDDPTALEPAARAEYARALAAPGALHGGIEYFRAHRIDAPANRARARTPLPMPVLTIGGASSFGPELGPQIAPLAANVRHVVIAGCGHYIAEEQPDRFVAELLAFTQDA